MIINCEEHDVIHNVEIGINLDKIINTFITEENELFVMTQKRDNYVLFKINLNIGQIHLNNSHTEEKY